MGEEEWPVAILAQVALQHSLQEIASMADFELKVNESNKGTELLLFRVAGMLCCEPVLCCLSVSSD